MSKLHLAPLHETDLLRGMHAVLFMDVVESVRIMEQHEDAFVRCWLVLIRALREEMLPPLRGRLVKSHGDGCLLMFDSVADAAEAAFQIQSRAPHFDASMPAGSPIRLRIGIHMCQVVVDEQDLFGAGVNLAARLAALAEPGTILVSAVAREQLVDGVGMHLCDLGEHRLKHIAQPVRTYELRSGTAAPGRAAVGLAVSPIDHRPGIAVLPFTRASGSAALPGLGQAVADDLTLALSRCALWRVISRLSTARCGGCAPGQALALVLGVPYLVSGSYREQGSGVQLHVELCDARCNEVVWAELYTLRVGEFFAGQDRALHDVVRAVGRRVLNLELSRTMALPFSRLEDYSLHLSAIALMHRLNPADMGRARDLIEALQQRHPRSAEPAAMLARWHALRMVQSSDATPAAEGSQALACARRALDRDPSHAFALPMAAMLAAQTGGPLLPALADAQRALDHNPQEPMAGLAYALLRGYVGDADDFERHAQESTGLTPLDPALYVYMSLLASAKISAGKPDEAIAAASSAVRAHATYATAHLMMTMAQSMAGNLDLARKSAAHVLSLEPDFRVDLYMSEFNGRHPPNAPARRQALLAAGLPN